ncbi:ketoacyl-ACP synthase III [Corynebacterium diphtheriae bv. mitis]|uniref:3-oxoacyl-ACP synthase III family protein n=2 Tax=Corynebacterium diphtheriae TaxID=1717 RepID=UPI0018CAAA07|nr:ketoacyl-ACP synthase III [Corynebacterium diphtheriae]MBG9313568.1 ketoacyl-ACP synthase III [Corynebacterium diphtheriae bv. mitis]
MKGECHIPSTTISLLGLGYSCPNQSIGNEVIDSWTGKDNDWIKRKTGIETRYYSDDSTYLDEFATEAALSAISDSELTIDDIDGVVCSTSTATQTIPATASLISRRLGIRRHVPALDINAVCSGWAYSVAVAKGFLLSHPELKNILVVSADAYSRIMNREDPTTVTLFGDGAAASVISSAAVLHSVSGLKMRNASDMADAVKTQGTLTTTSGAGEYVPRPQFSMDGKTVLRTAHEVIPSLVDEILQDAAMSKEDINHLILHQGNVRMVETLTEKLGFHSSQVHINADSFGNTASASAPMALAEASQQGKFRKGDRILLLTIGGGITYAGMVITW